MGNRSANPWHAELQQPISIGGDHPVVDRIEKFVQSPKRFINKIRQKTPVNSNELQAKAVSEAEEYLVANGLDDVFINVRRYEPREQWERLRENDRIGPVWKYTAGSLNVIGYSLFPKRAFHSDSFSPYTNTLSINSSSPAKAIFQAAQAKQYRKQKWLGTYSVAQKAPIVPLLHISEVSSDALSYARARDRDDLANELYPLAYSKLGSAAISGVVFFFPIRTDVPFITSPLIKAASRSTGRLAGKLIADRQQAERQQNEASEDSQPNSDNSELPN